MLLETVLLATLLAFTQAQPHGRNGDDTISKNGMRFVNKVTIRAGFGPVFPPFMQNMTSDQIRGYFDIIHNNNISMNQQTQELNDWASQNDVSTQMTQYLQAQQNVQNELFQNASAVMQQLPSLFSQYQQIVNNNDITFDQQDQQLRDFVDQNPMAASVIAYLMTLEQLMNAPDLWKKELGADGMDYDYYGGMGGPPSNGPGMNRPGMNGRGPPGGGDQFNGPPYMGPGPMMDGEPDQRGPQNGAGMNGNGPNTFLYSTQNPNTGMMYNGMSDGQYPSSTTPSYEDYST
ncbi:hypothetical protein WR25_01693 [Diploscapter pachys]|uniref:SXP/RAL-2 family protein Ani s 5-like cation-binding domain-containing protein n=1 Tax=Diploscapter pachys TaxID=2018661 RepID=A0A2A2JSR4_9BILA|nr:hypothetical protein WR25_01693 [Diploscapter pachys]